jgi:hypothetical protein
MSHKDDLLKRLDEGHAEFKACLKGLSDAEMTEVWLGSWSVKDILAHVSGWQREMVPALGRIGRGERPTPEGTDYSNVHPWNDVFVERQRSRSLAEMRQELDDAFVAFRAAAVAVPEERWERGRTVDRMIHASGISHYREHRAEIEAWRKSR